MEGDQWREQKKMMKRGTQEMKKQRKHERKNKYSFKGKT